MTEIVQAKCWSKAKVLHEKHLFQLFGTTVHYRLANPSNQVTPVLTTTTSLSEVALEVSRALGIRVDSIPLPSSYAMIKCNINPSTREKIYHLPFDQQHDRTQVSRSGECYVETVKEAEHHGFRRRLATPCSPSRVSAQLQHPADELTRAADACVRQTSSSCPSQWRWRKQKPTNRSAPLKSSLDSEFMGASSANKKRTHRGARYGWKHRAPSDC
jgi:hypothetical protein